MLVRKLANLDNYEEIYADFEERFTADSGNSTIIPLGKDWRTVGIQVSGGLDSALLLYLTTRAIQKLNLDIKIQPISVFIPSKVKNIASTEAIISKIREITNADFINDGLVFNMPMEETSTHDGKKDGFFINVIRSLFMDGTIDFEYNGNTKNPPEEARKNWKNDQHRQRNRDNASSIYTTAYSASPHYNMTKHDIINLYLKEGIFDDIAPLTCSCDENVTVVQEFKLNVPCGTCWWCEERRWGFESNDVVDPANVLSYQEYITLD
tara:strand:- start:14245 stop:15042 length:798 start_codon:yes stop_codon:yes gene_type:complete